MKLAALVLVMVAHPWWWWLALAWLVVLVAMLTGSVEAILKDEMKERRHRIAISALGTFLYWTAILAIAVIATPAHAATFVRHADGRVTVMRFNADARLKVYPAPASPADSIHLRFTLPTRQTDGSCGEGAALSWIDSVRIVGRKRGPHPWNAAAWLAYQRQPDTLIAQKAVAWQRMGQLDSFVVAAMDTGATCWISVHGTKGWSPVCRWVRGWK